jgi:Uma2 family endonuclease
MATARITWQDTLLMPEDGKRYEAIDGEMYVTPAPSRRHQRISLNLARALCSLLEDPGHGWIYVAPTGVELPDTDEGVQPDIVFVSKAQSQILVEEGIRGVPHMIVEILSPGTADRDRTVKKKLYNRHGVAEYWVVDPDAGSVEVWDIASGADASVRYVDQLPVRMGGRTVGQIELPEIFAPEV